MTLSETRKRSFGTRRDVPVEDVPIRFPRSVRLPFPDHNVFARVQQCAVGRGCCERTNLKCPIAVVLYFADFNTNSVPPRSNNPFPRLSDSISTFDRGRFGDQPLGIVRVDERKRISVPFEERFLEQLDRYNLARKFESNSELFREASQVAAKLFPLDSGGCHTRRDEIIPANAG